MIMNHSCLTQAQQQIVVDIAKDAKIGPCVIGFGHDMYTSGILTGILWSCAFAAGAAGTAYYLKKKGGK